MDFGYEIKYKSGKENLAADALSRVEGSEILCMAISVVSSNLSNLIKDSYQLDVNTQYIVNTLQNGVLFLTSLWLMAYLEEKGRLW